MNRVRISVLIIILALGIVIFPNLSFAFEDTAFDAIITGINPVDIAVGSDGYIYVIDAGNYQVHKFDASGAPVWWTTNYPLINPQGIAVDPDGYIYVIDAGTYQVHKFDPSGALVEWSISGPLIYPRDIAVDSNGDIYIVPWDVDETSQVYKFDSSGAPVEWTINYLLIDPQCIAVGPYGYVYIVSWDVAGTFRVLYFDPIGQLAGWGPSDPIMDPRGIAVGPDASVYVVDGQQILKWDPVGSFMGSSNYIFESPQGIAVGPGGEIYVADVDQVLKSQPQTPSMTITETDGNTTVSEAGGMDSFTVVLDVVPSSNVVLDLSSVDIGEATVDKTSLTFTAADWNVPQIVTVTGVDDDVVDGIQTSTVTISVDTVSSDALYGGVANQTVSVTTTDDDVAGITVSKLSLNVSESGVTDTFTVVLDAEASTDVFLDIASDDTSESTVDLSSLMFTAANWNVPQTVTVTGVDDDVVDGSQTSTVTISVDIGSSDVLYGGVVNQTVSVTTTDDDETGFTVSKSNATVSETGGTDTFTVVLNAEASTDVVLDISSNDTGEATVNPASLTFTATDWDTPQTVTVTGVDDDAVDGSQTSTVLIGVNDFLSDDTYDSVVDQTVSVTTTDEDIAGFTISKSSLTVSEAGGTDDFTVVLDAEPSSDVVLDIVSDDIGEVTVDQVSLTFTSANWNATQTVIAMGADDNLIDGIQTSTVTISVNDAYSDDVFDALSDKILSVETTDDEVAVPVDGVFLDLTEVIIAEGYPATLVAAVSPEDATDLVSITWESSDSGETTVEMFDNLDGTVTITAVPEAEGDVVIMVTAVNDYGTATAGCHVTVLTPIDNILYVIDECICDGTLVSNGETEKIEDFIDLVEEVKMFLENDDIIAAQNKLDKIYMKIDGASKPKDLVIVDSEVDLAAMILELRESLTVSVTGVTLNETAMTLQVSDEELLIATIEPFDATNQSLIWVTSDKKVVKVSNDGTVTAKSAGTATITVTTVDGEYVATCNVTVVEP